MSCSCANKYYPFQGERLRKVSSVGISGGARNEGAKTNAFFGDPNDDRARTFPEGGLRTCALCLLAFANSYVCTYVWAFKPRGWSCLVGKSLLATHGWRASTPPRFRPLCPPSWYLPFSLTRWVTSLRPDALLPVELDPGVTGIAYLIRQASRFTAIHTRIPGGNLPGVSKQARLKSLSPRNHPVFWGCSETERTQIERKRERIENKMQR